MGIPACSSNPKRGQRCPRFKFNSELAESLQGIEDLGYL